MEMKVVYVQDMRGDEVNSKHGFAPAGLAGDEVTVPFDLGARLVAAGYAVHPEAEPVEEPNEDNE